MVIFIHSKTKKMFFWNFGGQNHDISKIRDSHLVELVILRLTCVLYASPFNSLPFMDSQTIATFGSEIACSDVTKTLIAPKFSVRYFWNFVRRWSIQFVTASYFWFGSDRVIELVTELWQSYFWFGAAAPRQTRNNSVEKVGAFNTPRPPQQVAG